MGGGHFDPLPLWSDLLVKIQGLMYITENNAYL